MKSDARGFLTKEDRAYLTGESDLAEGSEYNTRRRIKNRARQGFLDYKLLFDHLPEDDRRDLFEGEIDVSMNESFGEAIRDTLALIFLGTRGSPYFRGSSHVNDPWGKIFTAAIEYAGLEKGYHVNDVEFEVDAEPVNIDRAKEKLEKGGKLSAGEIKVLIDEGEAEIRPSSE